MFLVSWILFANSMTASWCPATGFSLEFPFSLPSFSCPFILSFIPTTNISWNLLCFTVPEVLHHLLYLLHQQVTPLPFSPNSRLCLAYGGSDVSRCFYWLMQRAGFPYRECQLTNKMDCLLLQHLKETFCHLDQVGAQSKLIIFVFRKNLRYLKGN